MWTGFKVMGMPETPPFDWHDLSINALYDQIMPYAVPFIVGGLVLSTVASILAYILAYVIISRYRARHAHATVSADPLPPDQA
jgi:hypothetical protein